MMNWIASVSYTHLDVYKRQAASLLKFYESESTEKIQLKKLEERGDFFLTYAECILGLLRYDKEKHILLIRQIANDETRDQKLREFAEDAEKNYC